jgi:predicted MFS family arabinose efflux permease
MLGWKANFNFLAVYGLIVYLTALNLPETNKNITKLSINTIKNNYIEILTCKKFINSSICLAAGYSQIAIFNVIAPFIFEENMRYSPLIYGHIALVIGFACFSGSIINRFLIKKFSPSTIVNSGTIIMLISSLVFLADALFLPLTIFNLILPIFLILGCVGMIYPNCSAICLSMFPKMAGSASAIMGVITILGAVVMTSIASILELTAVLPLALVYLLLTVLTLISVGLINERVKVTSYIINKEFK